ncbi:hypothetical protein EB796_013238 [Bugula neritina]|uniref:Uncharacterized protein n=1 Tax=Bugula neritina TaxID=10212 RepID=A0A7J7JR76_BUGNE|nr:hypothetical protein EB796_013238 [Bugula neritina]
MNTLIITFFAVLAVCSVTNGVRLTRRCPNSQEPFGPKYNPGCESKADCTAPDVCCTSPYSTTKYCVKGEVVPPLH